MLSQRLKTGTKFSSSSQPLGHSWPQSLQGPDAKERNILSPKEHAPKPSKPWPFFPRVSSFWLDHSRTWGHYQNSSKYRIIPLSLRKNPIIPSKISPQNSEKSHEKSHIRFRTPQIHPGPRLRKWLDPPAPSVAASLKPGNPVAATPRKASIPQWPLLGAWRCSGAPGRWPRLHQWNMLVIVTSCDIHGDLYFFWGDGTIANLMETWEIEMISPLASGKLTVCLWNNYI